MLPMGKGPLALDRSTSGWTGQNGDQRGGRWWREQTPEAAGQGENPAGQWLLIRVGLAKGAVEGKNAAGAGAAAAGNCKPVNRETLGVGGGRAAAQQERPPRPRL